MAGKNINLLSNLTRVETPFVKVTIGDYVFGIYTQESIQNIPALKYSVSKIKFPNYIQSLRVKKINGAVNTYTLVINFPITPETDPNYIEKIISSVSKTRKIVFSYGDLSTPTFIYKEEEGIITRVRESISVKTPAISYTITAVSNSKLGLSATHDFAATTAKPSDIIKFLLWEDKSDSTGLQELFYGMAANRTQAEIDNLIASDDAPTKLEAKQSISVLDYLNYLVSSMTPLNSNNNSIVKDAVYMLSVVDDTTGKYGGPYFKVTKISNNSSDYDSIDTYTIDVGYPSDNIVISFEVDDDNTYSLYYDYTDKISNDNYALRINDNGETYYEFCPRIGSNSKLYKATASTISWWTDVTQFPISAKLTLKGLLRPAILMTNIRLNVYFFGKKHVSSGLYVITNQEDIITMNDGYRTTLTLKRIGKDKDYSSVV